MLTRTTIDEKEFQLIRQYIKKYCGISLSDEKKYLVETRLTTLMVESGCTNFFEFYQLAVSDQTNVLRNKIVDAMTTNETLWFRDKSPYVIMSDALLDKYAEMLSTGQKSKLRIWSAACSTGQEPYSIAMVILDYIKKKGKIRPDQIEIVATDISPTVLFLAKLGKYDGLSMSRGMTDDIKNRYFEPAGKVWKVVDEVKKMVTFKTLNLQESYSSLGTLDIVFVRNVLIYFADDFKKDILNRVADLLRPSGYLLLGASESIISMSDRFNMIKHDRSIYYQVKQ